MCQSCITSAEAVVINAGLGIAVVRGTGRRVLDHLARRHPVERRRAAWEETAAFAISMGLDPAQVLPPAPDASEAPPALSAERSRDRGAVPAPRIGHAVRA